MKKLLGILLSVSIIAMLATGCPTTSSSTKDKEKEKTEKTETEAVSEETDAPDSTTSAGEGERPQRRITSSDDVVDVVIDRCKISVPDYWKTKVSTSAKYVAYAETGEKMATLHIHTYIDTEDPVTFEVLKRDTDNGAMSEYFAKNFASCGEVSYEEYENGEVKGYIYSGVGKNQGSDLDFFAQLLCFPSEKSGTWIYVFVESSNNCEYQYSEDFRNIIDSIRFLTADEEAEIAKEKEKNKDKYSYDDYVSMFASGDFSLVTPSFKEEMDAYEAFYDEYIDFMKKYYSGGTANLGDMLNDYNKMLEKEMEWAEKIDAVDETTLSPADDAYFLMVTLRIEEKLLSIYGISLNF